MISSMQSDWSHAIILNRRKTQRRVFGRSANNLRGTRILGTCKRLQKLDKDSVETIRAEVFSTFGRVVHGIFFV